MIDWGHRKACHQTQRTVNLVLVPLVKLLVHLLDLVVRHAVLLHDVVKLIWRNNAKALLIKLLERSPDLFNALLIRVKRNSKQGRLLKLVIPEIVVNVTNHTVVCVICWLSRSESLGGEQGESAPSSETDLCGGPSGPSRGSMDLSAPPLPMAAVLGPWSTASERTLCTP